MRLLDNPTALLSVCLLCVCLQSERSDAEIVRHDQRMADQNRLSKMNAQEEEKKCV